MSPDQNTPKPTGKDEPQNRKTGSSRPQEPVLKCPRCDSPNTKFCYYNNYSLTQPRHFCKTCRRYWTKGGALRNVPIGGGCRKNKKLKSSSRLSGESKDPTDIGGLKFFQGLSPAMDFQTSLYNQFPSFGGGDLSGSSSSPLMMFQEMTESMNVHSSLTSSIENLSSINQDLHWKLQQQRLSMMFSEDNQKDILMENNSALPIETTSLVQKPQPILFQNLDVHERPESCGNLSTEWFFDHTFASLAQTQAAAATTTANVNENIGSSGSNWSGIQAWSDLTQYTALP